MSDADRSLSALVWSRREGPRLEVEALIDGHLSRGAHPLQLVDVGFGGFAVEGDLAFEPGSGHGFRFWTVSGITILLHADAVYCRESVPPGESTRYVSGFRYRVATEREQHAVDILIETASSPLSFP